MEPINFYTNVTEQAMTWELNELDEKLLTPPRSRATPRLGRRVGFLWDEKIL